MLIKGKSRSGRKDGIAHLLFYHFKLKQDSV